MPIQSPRSPRRHDEDIRRALKHQHDLLHKVFEMMEHEHELLHNLTERMDTLMTTIAAINAAIDAAAVEAEETTVAVTAIAGYIEAIKAQLTQVQADLAAALAANDPAGMQAALDKLAALNAKIDAQQAALAAMSGTPAEEPPAEPPVEEPPVEEPPVEEQPV